MTELVPDPSPAKPKRGLRLVIFLLIVIAVTLAYIIYAQKKAAVAIQPAVPTTVETSATPPAPTQPTPPPAVTPEPAPAPQPPPQPAPVPEQATTAPAPAPTPAAVPTPPPSGLVEAEAARKAGRLQEAREKAQAALEQAAGNPALVQEAEKALGAIDIEQLFTPRPMPEKSDYIVQPGDSLDKIAHKYGTTVELIQKSNNIHGALIKAGDRLRVFSGTWAIRVNKTRNDLLLTLNGKFFKRYRVGTGEYSKTPVGEFKIVDRIAQPTWWHPDGRTIPYGDPENLLGTHWLALDIKGYGIHGTWEPETVGKQSSLGCVRLVNEEVEELFTLVTIGTPVIIEE